MRAFLWAQDVTARIAEADLDRTIRTWASTHAFLEDEHGARLTPPDPEAAIEWRRGIPAPAAYWADQDLQSRLDGLDDAASALGLR